MKANRQLPTCPPGPRSTPLTDDGVSAEYRYLPAEMMKAPHVPGSGWLGYFVLKNGGPCCRSPARIDAQAGRRSETSTNSTPLAEDGALEHPSNVHSTFGGYSSRRTSVSVRPSRGLFAAKEAVRSRARRARLVV